VTSEPGLDGAYVRLRLQDNGSGMPDHIARRGRDGDFSPPPAQIPASGTTALGSHLGS
jgi:hypothetical protein